MFAILSTITPIEVKNVLCIKFNSKKNEHKGNFFVNTSPKWGGVFNKVFCSLIIFRYYIFVQVA